MNYIQRLIKENEEKAQRLANIQAEMNRFMVHLHSNKFAGFENGERKDWISTGDVLNWLRDVRMETIQ